MIGCLSSGQSESEVTVAVSVVGARFSNKSVGTTVVGYHLPKQVCSVNIKFYNFKMGIDINSFKTEQEQITNHINHTQKINFMKHYNELLALKVMNRDLSKMLRIQNGEELNKHYQASQEIIKNVFKQK